MGDSETSADEDIEQQFISLLEGLRVTLTGVQLVTAFLLTLPLYDRFVDLNHSERGAYYIAFGCGLASSMLLTAPSSHQRLRARHGKVARHSRRHLAVAVRLTIAGSALFGVALSAAAFLVASLVLATPVAIAVTATMSLLLAWSWFWLPLVSFEKD